MRGEKYKRKDNNSVGTAEALLDELDPLLQGFHPVLKLAVGKLYQGLQFKGFVLEHLPKSRLPLAKALEPLDHEVQPVEHVLVQLAAMPLRGLELFIQLFVKLSAERRSQCFYLFAKLLPESALRATYDLLDLSQ
jgi:hypothetical protein